MSSRRASPSTFVKDVTETFFMNRKEKIEHLSKIWIEFFDKFCVELADRVENPAKLFGSFGSKCKASATGEEIVRACMVNLGDLQIAIENRRSIHKARSAELNAALDKIASFIPAGSMVLGKEYDRLSNSMCKFVVASLIAVEVFKADGAELPARLQGLRTNAISTHKLNYIKNISDGYQLIEVLGCRTPEEKALLARLVASGTAAISARIRRNLPKFEEAPTHEVRIASSAAAKRKSTSSETRRRRATSAAAKRKSSSYISTRRNRA